MTTATFPDRTVTARGWRATPARAARAGGGSPERDGWAEQFRRLDSLRELQDDWDGLEAKAPRAELVDSALVLGWILRQQGVAAPCRVVPGVNGTVLLEWQSEGAYCEIEVTEPYRGEVMQILPGQPAQHWVLTDEGSANASSPEGNGAQ